MRFHCQIKTRYVDRPALFAQRVLGQIKRKAERVVKPEGGGTRQSLALPKAVKLVIKQTQAAVEGLFEAGFFQLQGFLDQRLCPGQLGIGRPHLLHQCRHQTEHHRINGAKHMGMAHGAAHDPAQHIAAPLV